MNLFVILPVILILSLGTVSVTDSYSQVTDLPCDRGSDDKCNANRRIIVYAVFEKDNRRGEDLQSLLETRKTVAPPVITEFPIQRTDRDDTHEIISTSFEYPSRGGSLLVDELKNQIHLSGLLDDAVFIRITIFDTWHHFGEGDLRSCELVEVIERGILDD